MEIRPDFKIFETQLTQLSLYASEADKFNIEDWSHLKNGENYSDIYALPHAQRYAFEEIYCTGRDCAGWMSIHFGKFNDIGEFPTISAYINSFEDTWVYQIESLEKKSAQAKAQAQNPGTPWAVKRMIELFDRQVQMLKAAASVVEKLKSLEKNMNEAGDFKNDNKTSNQTQIAVALIAAIVPALVSAYIGYLQGVKSTDASTVAKELSNAISLNKFENPNFRRLTYPNYGLSLFVPISWQLEDGPARLAGGEFNVVARYEETKGAIGINFRLRPVQPNYIDDISTQVQNQKDSFEKSFGSVTISDCGISGAPAKLFEYEAPTGKRKMKVRLYWVRLVPDVQLQIQAAHYTDAADSVEFWRQSDQVISSIVIAFDSWQARNKREAKN